MIPLSWYLFLGAIFFSFGLYGILTRRNIISILVSIEIMFNAANLNFVAFSRYFPLKSIGDQTTGPIFALFVVTVAVAEIAIGLALILIAYSKLGTINIGEIKLMKG